MSVKNETGFSLLAKFVGWSAILGIVGSIFLAPALIGSSSVLGAGVALFEALPSYLKPENGSNASTIYANNGDEKVPIASFYEENRKSITFDQMSKNLVNAVIATEDPRFYQHGGVDWVSFFRASLGAAVSGGGPGGSTITMQYVKNTLVEQATQAEDKEAAAAAVVSSGIPGLMRKIREIRLALQLEENVSKEDILAGYLNLSFFGGRTYGVEQAAEFYFGVKASELNIEQSALIAAMLKSPNEYRPDVPENLKMAKSRRDYVIENMRAEGFITDAEARTATEAPIVVNENVEPAGCEANQTTAFFCDYVVWTIRNSPEFGPTLNDREKLLRRGGLQIYTTLDLRIQSVADKNMKKLLPPDNKEKVGSASATVEVGTGRVVSIAVNRIYDQTENASKKAGHTSVNYATDKEFGGSSGFQVGSSYKVFTLAEWLNTGHQLGDKVDARIRTYAPTDFNSHCGGLADAWKPGNDVKGEPENPNVKQALAISENTAFAAMASQLDLCNIRDTAIKFGVHRADGQPLGYTQSSILGVNEIAPLTMAAAFAGIANHGQYCTPVAIDRMVNMVGEEMKVPKSICSEAVTQDVAAAMIVAMKGVFAGGGTATASNTGDGAELAGKTGTTDGSVQSWMTGFSTKLSTSLWVGNVMGTKSMRKTSVKGKIAYNSRHVIWKAIMKAGNKFYKPGSFDPAPKTLTGATMVDVPNVTGMSPEDAQAALKAAGLPFNVEKTTMLSMQPSGTIAATKPASGGQVVSGTIIRLWVSEGGEVVVPSVAGLTVQAAIARLATYNLIGTEPVANSSEQARFFKSSPTVPAGRVITTVPAPGTRVSYGGAVLFVISTGP